MQPQKPTVRSLYADATLWTGTNTMKHASGVFGRIHMLERLKDGILRPGQMVYDLGCGAGHPTKIISELVQPNGRVIGFDTSDEMLAEAIKLEQSPQLEFQHADITKTLPVANRSADVVTSFMALHNLPFKDAQGMMRQTERILKPNCPAVFLTIHPEALESDWDFDFIVYNPDDLRKYRRAMPMARGDMQLSGKVRNAGSSDTKDVTMFYHSYGAVEQIVRDAGLLFIESTPLWIDEKIARETFGPDSVRKMPTTPMYWMFIVKRPVE